MNLDRQLDRLERMLIRCINASDLERRERRKQMRGQTKEMKARADEWMEQRNAPAHGEEFDKLRNVQDRTDKQKGQDGKSST